MHTMEHAERSDVDASAPTARQYRLLCSMQLVEATDTEVGAKAATWSLSRIQSATASTTLMFAINEPWRANESWSVKYSPEDPVSSGSSRQTPREGVVHCRSCRWPWNKQYILGYSYTATKKSTTTAETRPAYTSSGSTPFTTGRGITASSTGPKIVCPA